MNSQLNTFEEYVNSLTNLGVFPSFHRLSNGWICILRNSINRQIMPFDKEERCWGETIMSALTLAVEGLNARFIEPKELREYIDTGLERKPLETVQKENYAYAQ